MQSIQLAITGFLVGALLFALIAWLLMNRRSDRAAPLEGSETIEDLQKLKLKVEIQDLTRPAYRKPTVMIAGAGAVAALLGVLAQGWLSKINGAKADLDRARAEVLRDSARVQLGRIEHQMGMTQVHVASLRQDSIRIQGQLVSLEDEATRLLTLRNCSVRSGPLAQPSTAEIESVFEQLYSDSPAVRLRAYDALMTKFNRDVELVPKLLSFARAHESNLNGTYNALVVFSHLDRDRTRPYADPIRDFAQEVSPRGSRIAQRARILLNRLP
jgi:hypothetical protein